MEIKVGSPRGEIRTWFHRDGSGATIDGQPVPVEAAIQAMRDARGMAGPRKVGWVFEAGPLAGSTRIVKGGR